MLKLAHVLAELESTPCAADPDRLQSFHRYLLTRSNGGSLAIATAAPAVDVMDPQAAKPGKDTARAPGAVAVINVFGAIAQRVSAMDEMCGMGGTSTERLSASFRAAINDPNIKAVVLNVSSPGGTVFGVAEFADEIFRARGAKPIVAIANSFAASAAYWIASAADELVVVPSGQVGSIGVYTVHMDASALYEAEGVKPTLIKAGKFKAEGMDFMPLSAEAIDHMQASVDSYYTDFIKAVAKHRGVPVGEVRDGFGQGRMVRANEAVAAKMADRVETLDGVLKRLGASSGAQQATRADLPALDIAASDDEGPIDDAPAASAPEPEDDRDNRERRQRMRGLI